MKNSKFYSKFGFILTENCFPRLNRIDDILFMFELVSGWLSTAYIQSLRVFDYLNDRRCYRFHSSK